MPPATAPGPLLPATLAQARQQMEEPQGNRPRRPRLNLAKNRPQAGNPLYLLNLMRLNTKLNAIARRGGEEHEDRCRACPLVLVIDAPGTVRRRRDRLAGFVDQLHGLLVHAHHRSLGVVRTLARFQNLFHARRKFGVGLGRDHPILHLAPGDAVSFSVRFTVSSLVDATVPSSTTRRANSRSDQFA